MPATSHPGTKQLDTGTIYFTINQIEFSGKDADKLRRKIETEISSGGHVNKLELIFMPLMRSELSKTALLFEAIKLGKALPDSSERNKVIVLTLVMANKLVKPDIIEEIWEEIKMLEIIKYAEQIGVKKGRLEGKIEGKEEGRVEGRVEGKISLVKRLLQKKFGY